MSKPSIQIGKWYRSKKLLDRGCAEIPGFSFQVQWFYDVNKKNGSSDAMYPAAYTTYYNTQYTTYRESTEAAWRRVS